MSRVFTCEAGAGAEHPTGTPTMLSNRACLTSHAHKTSTAERQTLTGKETHGSRKTSPKATGNQREH